MLPLDTLKLLLGITDDSQDMVLRYVMDSVEESICNYCNIHQVPFGLINTASRMAVDMYRGEGFGQAAAPAGEASSITEGDTTVSFRSSGDSKTYAVYAAGLLKNYASQLNRYRRLKKPCPCCNP